MVILCLEKKSTDFEKRVKFLTAESDYLL